MILHGGDSIKSMQDKPFYLHGILALNPYPPPYSLLLQNDPFPIYPLLDAVHHVGCTVAMAIKPEEEGPGPLEARGGA